MFMGTICGYQQEGGRGKEMILRGEDDATHIHMKTA
jgi:hypothetical protein